MKTTLLQVFGGVAYPQMRIQANDIFHAQTLGRFGSDQAAQIMVPIGRQLVAVADMSQGPRFIVIQVSVVVLVKHFKYLTGGVFFKGVGQE